MDENGLKISVPVQTKHNNTLFIFHPQATVIEIGDERLKLPPSYEDCDGVEPPTYDEWAALVVETV